MWIFSPFVKTWHIVLWCLTCAVGCLFTLFRLSIVAPAGSVVLTVICGWLFIWALGILATFQGFHQKIAGGLAVLAGFCVIAISIATYFPGFTEAAHVVLNRIQRHSAQNAHAGDVAENPSFPCDKSNAAHIRFYGYNEASGATEPLVWVTRNPMTGQLECFHSGGVSPYTGKALVVVNDDILKGIAQQEPPHPVSPPTTVAVAPAPIVDPPHQLDPPPTTVPPRQSVSSRVDELPGRMQRTSSPTTPSESSDEATQPPPTSRRLAPRCAQDRVIMIAIPEPVDFGTNPANAHITIATTIVGDLIDTTGNPLGMNRAPVRLTARIDPRSVDHRQHTAKVFLRVVEINGQEMEGGSIINVTTTREGLRGNVVKGAAAGAAVGAIHGSRKSRGQMLRELALGLAVGAGSGAILSKDHYILAARQYPVLMEQPVCIP